MKLSYMATCAAAAIYLAAFSGSAFGQNLIANGSFETEPASVVTNGVSYLYNGEPAPTDWTFTPSDLNSYSITESSSDTNGLVTDAANNPVGPEDGSWYVALAGANNAGTAGPSSVADYDTISQAVQTQAGVTYDLSYYMYSFGGSGTTYQGGYFLATWNGSVVSGSEVDDVQTPSGWTKYDLTVVGTGGSDVLGLSGFNYLYYQGVDNVSLVAQSVPEPSAFAALGIGLVGLFIKRRK